MKVQKAAGPKLLSDEKEKAMEKRENIERFPLFHSTCPCYDDE
jgi:hypothetical protein